MPKSHRYGNEIVYELMGSQTPFVTISFGMETSKWGRKVSEIILKTRKEGLGETKVTAVFPY